MTFSVNTTALGGLPTFLDRRENDLDAARHYLQTNTTLRYGSGLATVTGQHQAIVGSVNRYLAAASGNYARTDALRLRQAINSYMYADSRAAQRADDALPPWRGATRPSTPAIGGVRAPGPAIFNDPSTPVAALVPPADHHADMPYQPSWFDLLSPGSTLRDAIWYASGVAARFGLLDQAYDPFEYLVGPYVGDWAGLLRCAEIFERIGDLLVGDALVIDGADGLVPAIWTGNAADMCIANLAGFADCLRGGVAPLRSIAASYRSVAQGVHDNADLLAALLTDLFDYGTGAVLDIETLGLFSAYEVGSVLGNFAKTFRVVLRTAGTCQDIVSAGFSVSDDAAHRLGILTEMASMPLLTGPVPKIAPGPELPPVAPRVLVPHV